MAKGTSWHFWLLVAGAVLLAPVLFIGTLMMIYGRKGVFAMGQGGGLFAVFAIAAAFAVAVMGTVGAIFVVLLITSPRRPDTTVMESQLVRRAAWVVLTMLAAAAVFYAAYRFT